MSSLYWWIILLSKYNNLLKLLTECHMKNEVHQCFVKIILLTWTHFFYYKSDLTPNPGPGGSPFRLVSPPTGSDAKRPFLQQNDITEYWLSI